MKPNNIYVDKRTYDYVYGGNDLKYKWRCECIANLLWENHIRRLIRQGKSTRILR